MMVKPTLRFMFARPERMIAMSFGAGLSPVWPGTVGALAGGALFAAMLPLPAAQKIVLYALLFLIGVWACGRAEEALGKEDHQAIVFDESWAMAVTLEFAQPHPGWWITAFLLFRFFDIVKPWPVKLGHRRMRGGWAVMMDDALAAAYAVIALLILAALWSAVGG